MLSDSASDLPASAPLPATPAGEAEVTLRLARRARDGDAEARNALYDRLYASLREVARAHLRREGGVQSLAPTELVHELFLRLDASPLPLVHDRQHLLAIASQVMRRVLVDHARARGAQKRGRGLTVTLDDVAPDRAPTPVELLDLHDALERLAVAEPRVARVFELRAFAGLELEEIAEHLLVSRSTVKRDWQFARAWMTRALALADVRA